MDSIHLVEYMAWVPIVGSAFGNLLGGFVSDYFIGKNHSASTSALNKNGTQTHLQDALLPDSGASNRRNVHQDKHEARDNAVHSTEKEPVLAVRAVLPVDQSLRMLIAGWSNLLPVPLIICALLVEFPYCFLVMIASGMVSSRR